MKISLALIAMIAVSCVLAAPKTLKAISKAKMSARLQVAHKSVRPLSAHPVKKTHHVKLHAGKPSRHSEEAFRVVREQQIALKTKDSYYIGVRPTEKGSVFQGSRELGETEKLTLLTLADGKVAIRSPQGDAYLNMHPGGHRAKVDLVSSLIESATFELISNADGSSSFKSVYGTYLKEELVRGVITLMAQVYIGTMEKFTLVNLFRVVAEERVAIKDEDGTLLGVRADAEGPVVAGSRSVGETEVWLLQHLDYGKVALKAAAQGGFLRVHPGAQGAKVDVAAKIEEWATFDLIQNADGSVTFRSVHGTHLRSEKVAGVTVVDAQTFVGHREEFHLVAPIVVRREKVGALKTYHGTFVRFRKDGTQIVVDQSSKLGETEKLALLFLDSGKVAIQSAQGLYLSVPAAGAKVPVVPQVDLSDSGVFELIQNPDGTLTFKSTQGNYLRADKGPEGSKIDTQTYIDIWEHFTFVDLAGAPLAIN